MNHARTAIAVSALALSAAALGATQASARQGPEPGSGYTTTPDCHWAYHPVCHEVPVPGPGNAPTASETAMYDWPDEGSGYPGSEATSPDYNHPNYDPRYEVPRVEAATVSSASDDNGAETIQTGASALGGAGIALGAVWIYRRRQAMNG